MELLIIAILIFVIISINFLPLEKIMIRKNLHKLILFLNERDNNVNTNKESFKKRVLIFSEKIHKKLNIKISEEKYEKYKGKLVFLNLNNEISVESILGIKILVSAVVFFYFGLSVIMSASFVNFMLLIIGTALGYYIPDNMLNIRIKNRQLELQRQLPNTLKTLAITTEAGLNFWEAIRKVCEVKNGALIDEFRNMLDEVNMGAMQRDALMKLSEKCKVTEITVFVFTIMQSLEKGSAGITRALNEQANEVWDIRKSKAKEMGQKASIKLFFSMLLFVFPCLLIFLLGPAVISIMKLFTNN